MKINFDKMMKIHESSASYVFAITGGGTELIGDILKNGGASKTVLEVIVPYSQKSLVDLIGAEPERYACEKTAILMAMAAFNRAKKISGNNCFIAGISATCKLAFNGRPEREGRVHSIHVAVQTNSYLKTANLKFTKNRTRLEEEEIAANLIFEVLYWSSTNFSPEICISGEKVEYKEVRVNDTDMLQFLNGQINMLIPPSCMNHNLESGPIVFPGSFNPLHKNHLKMAEIIYDKYKVPVDFEISISNVDKDSIDFFTIHDRIHQFEKNHDCFVGNLYLTHAPKFIDKAALFVNPTFVVGSDTINRVFNENYNNVQDTIDEMVDLGVRFIVFKRVGHSIIDFNSYKIPSDMITIIDGYEDDGTSSSKIRGEK